MWLIYFNRCMKQFSMSLLLPVWQFCEKPRVLRHLNNVIIFDVPSFGWFHY